MKTFTILTLSLIAAALAGCGSSSTESIIAPAVLDTAPPAVPTGLHAAAGRSAVKLSWAPNMADADCVGFHVYRIAFGQVWPQTEAPVAVTRWLDEAPLIGPAEYAITAVDAAGNESAWTRIAFDYAPEMPSVARD